MFAVRIGIVAAVFLTATPAFAGPPPHQSSADHGGRRVHVDARCAGDTISGTVSMEAPAGETYRLDLSYRPRGRSGWSGTGRSAAFTSDGTRRSYDYSFDVSPFNAFAYRLDLAGEHSWSQTLPASSCGPGHQVPEAPYSLLLPLSLLGTSGLLFLRRRFP